MLSITFLLSCTCLLKTLQPIHGATEEDSLALLQVPLPRGQQVHMRIQLAQIEVDARGGRIVPVDGRLHVVQVVLIEVRGIAWVDFEAVSLAPANRRGAPQQSSTSAPVNFKGVPLISAGRDSKSMACSHTGVSACS